MKDDEGGSDEPRSRNDLCAEYRTCGVQTRPSKRGLWQRCAKPTTVIWEKDYGASRMWSCAEHERKRRGWTRVAVR